MRRALLHASVKNPPLLKDLLTYPWDHDGPIWHESRAPRILRTQSKPCHELLCISIPLDDHARREVHWRQVFKRNELPWVSGHETQGEVLFPITRYLAMAYEAAMYLVDDSNTVQLVELHDVEIVCAVVLPKESPGLKVCFTFRVNSQSKSALAAEIATAAILMQPRQMAD